MKATRVLSWQTLISKIHPPLPMSSLETQRLLALIQTSFQRHLDKETATGQHYTKEHLQSVLTSPLLTSKRTDPPVKFSNLRPQGGESISELQESTRRPLTAFKEQIAKGTASLGIAKTCLATLLQNCIQSDAASPVTAMAGAGASAVFLNWLWSSGMAETGSFFKDRQFVNLLTSFLVAEQRYGVILQLLSSLRVHRSIFTLRPAEKERAQANLLLQLAKAECDYGAGIGGSMTHFVQVFQRNEALSYKQSPEIFKPSGRYISETLSDPKKMHNVSLGIVDAFISSTTGWSHRDSLIYAWQCAYHPTQPSPELGFRYLERLTEEKALCCPAHMKSMILRMSLRISELFVKQHELARASAVLDFIRTHFAKDVGAERVISEGVPGTNSVRSQDENLRLLEALAIS